MSDNEKGFVPNEENLNEDIESAVDSSTPNPESDYAHYSDAANSVPPQSAEPESAYSPYSQQGYQQQPDYMYAQPNYPLGYVPPVYGYAQAPYSQQGYQQPVYAQQPPIYDRQSKYVDPLDDSDEPQDSEEQHDDNNDKKKKKKHKGFIAFLISVAVIICIVVAMFFLYPYLPKFQEETAVTDDSTQLIISETPAFTEGSESLTTIQIAESAEKINVGILIYGKEQSFIYGGGSNSLVGEGSGIIMSEDQSGKYTYILTCAHVISDAKSSNYTITVQDSDGNTYDGIMVGFDLKTDIGIIKIEKTGLSTATFGDSTALSKGQRVFAIGNPGGTEFFGSFSDGIVSSIDRPISSESGYEMKCIQHTTAINSGNSGGALLNEFGQVIGINSSKIVSEGYEGMAFAIPISDAKPIIDDIIANGAVTNRPKLGITYSTAMENGHYAVVVKINDLPSGSLILREINSDSSLANTEAQPYDIITEVDGKPLDTADVLLEKIDNGKVGDEITLTLCRVNEDYSVKEFTVKAKLVEDKGTDSGTSQDSSSQNYWENYFNNGF